jgi:hypothetical protein
MIEAWAIATWRTVGGRNEPNAGVPTAFLTANITVGMTLAQIANVLRAWAHDLLHG